MVKLRRIFSRLKAVRVGVIGDFMYDIYTTGQIQRISPEAPVPVLHALKEEGFPGGAGNVALNLVSLGAHVVAIGRVGADSFGQTLLKALSTKGVDTSRVSTQPSYQTTVKNRFIANSQQVLRVDFETTSPIAESIEKKVIQELPSFMQQIDILAISDYGKGFLSQSLLTATIAAAKAQNTLVIIDPKGDDYTKYQGASILKPNLQEAYAAAKLPLITPLDQVADALLKKVAVDLLMITRSEAGISLFPRSGGRADFPVHSRAVKDVTGAGDTVLAALIVALGSGLEMAEAVQLANIAAGCVIEQLGCGQVNASDIVDRLLEVNVDNKIFDQEHLFALQQALKNQSSIVLCIQSKQGMTTELFRTLRKLAEQNSSSKLVIYVEDLHPDEEFISLLSSLAEVDFVVLACDSLHGLCEAITPQEVFVTGPHKHKSFPPKTMSVG